MPSSPLQNEVINDKPQTLPGPDPITPLPGANPASRRRKALRDFYKLQASKNDQQPPETPQSTLSNDEDDSMADFIRDDESHSELDKPGTTVDDYIRNLIKDSDLKMIVKTENKLVSEIRALDSEQKALVYNNYNKLIAAANTLENMHKNEELSQVHQLKDSLNKVSLFVKSVSALPPTPAQTSNIEIPSDRIQAARWLLSSGNCLDSLISANKKEEAKLLATQTVELINNWPKGPQSLQDQLSVILKKCQDIININ